MIIRTPDISSPNSKLSYGVALQDQLIKDHNAGNKAGFYDKNNIVVNYINAAIAEAIAANFHKVQKGSSLDVSRFNEGQALDYLYCLRSMHDDMEDQTDIAGAIGIAQKHAAEINHWAAKPEDISNA